MEPNQTPGGHPDRSETERQILCSLTDIVNTISTPVVGADPESHCNMNISDCPKGVNAYTQKLDHSASGVMDFKWRCAFMPVRKAKMVNS